MNTEDYLEAKDHLLGKLLHADAEDLPHIEWEVKKRIAEYNASLSAQGGSKAAQTGEEK